MLASNLHQQIPQRSAQGGFTLIEVMISLAILAGMLTLLLRGAAGNVAATQQARLMTAATELARAKMYDIEEVLLRDGFQQTTQEDEGTFKDEGWPQISWKSEIVKIELPSAEALGGLSEGDDSEGGSSGGAGGLGGGGGLGGAIVGSQFEMMKSMMEESLRRVRLTISYTVAGTTDTFTVDCYFTDPAAIGRVNSLASGGAADTSSSDDTTSSESSENNNSRTRGGNRSERNGRNETGGKR